MEPWLIILIVFGSIAFLYLGMVVTSLSFFFSFRSYWKKHKKGLEVILSMKYENIKRIFDIFATNHIELDKSLFEKFNSIDTKVFSNMDSDEAKIAREKLNYVRDELFFISGKTPHLQVNEEFLLAKENVLEQDKMFRKNIAMYNADVLGYNYWSHFTPVRYLFLLTKVKDKEII